MKWKLYEKIIMNKKIKEWKMPEERLSDWRLLLTEWNGIQCTGSFIRRDLPITEACLLRTLVFLA